MSYIRTVNGVPKSGIYERCQVSVSDSGACDASQVQNAYGLAYVAEGYRVACNDEKTIGIHRFVSAETFLGCAKLEKYAGADSATYTLWDVKFSKECGGKFLIINTISDVISAHGLQGSVICTNTGFIHKMQVCNLYELLAMLMGEFNRNLLTYEEIALYSKSCAYVTVIKLKHTQEAERYYTKMLMDVMI